MFCPSRVASCCAWLGGALPLRKAGKGAVHRAVGVPTHSPASSDPNCATYCPLPRRAVWHAGVPRGPTLTIRCASCSPLPCGAVQCHVLCAVCGTQASLVARLQPATGAHPINDGLMRAINQVDAFLHAHREGEGELEALKAAVRHILLSQVGAVLGGMLGGLCSLMGRGHAVVRGRGSWRR